MDATEKPSRTRTFAGRGVCAECSTELTLIAGGLVIAHGPRDARCPGGGRPPRPAEPVAEAAPTADTTTEPSAAVEPAIAPVRYQEGDRVRSGGLLGSVEAVYGSTVEVTWDGGRVQTVDAETIERVERPEDEPAVEVAPLPPVTQPVYTLLDEDDGAIDGGAVTPRAQTSHADIPAEVPEPSLLGMAMRSRIEQLEAEAATRTPADCEAHQADVLRALLPNGCTLTREGREWGLDVGYFGWEAPKLAEIIAALIKEARRATWPQSPGCPPTSRPDCDAHRRRIAVLESQLDASREEVARLLQVVRDAVAERDQLSREADASAADARRSRDTLRGALDLIGRLGPA